MPSYLSIALASIKGPRFYNLQSPGAFKPGGSQVDKLDRRLSRIQRRITRELRRRGVNDSHDLSTKRFNETFGKLIASRKKIQKRLSV
jgi:hypothetical protein